MKYFRINLQDHTLFQLFYSFKEIKLANHYKNENKHLKTKLG